MFKDSVKFLSYYSSYITISGLLALYAFFCVPFTHSDLTKIAYLRINSILYMSHLFITFSLIIYTVFQLVFFKNGKIYFDSYIKLVLAYVTISILSLFLNGNFPYPEFGIVKSQGILLPVIAFFTFVQIFNIKHLKLIVKMLTAFSLINMVIFLFLWIFQLKGVDFNFGTAFTDRNLFARFIITTNVFHLTTFLASEKKRFFSFQLLFFLLTFFIITILLSRSGYIMFLASIAFIAWRSDSRIVKKLWPVATVFVLILFTVMVIVRFKSDKMDVKNVSDLGRISAMIAGINMVKEKPILGVGYGLAEHRFEKYQDREFPGLHTNQTIHNIYLNIWAEQGIFALIVYILFNFGLLYELFIEILKKPFKEAKYQVMAFTSLSIFMLHGLVNHSFDYEGHYWLILAIAVIILRDTKKNCTNYLVANS